ncbi:FAD-dependent monooxygenase [Devosia algicola]|uniref:FAD-dependent monooxygenase n=1 Tax=Devosia algicola TaxID=3026418 RepID=A0ABY7YLU3_9HYPH|nr:FAD-dependent monooxygenase [Devosia algicola]WDR01920.1 FAD-dependent monooxygenase [Devosia algicola]
MKIAINGCGIAGPTLAWWLRRDGHEPVLLERAKQVREGGYIIDFWGTGYDVAEQMGLLPALKTRGYNMEHLLTVTAGGRTTSSINATVFDTLAEGRYFSIARSALSAGIFQACEGIETRFGTEVTQIDDRGDQVIVGLSDGTSENFDLVVGADGLHSKIRALVFGPQEQFEQRLGFHVAAFTMNGYQPRDELTVVSHTVPGRFLSRVTLRDDRTLVLMVVADEYLRKMSQDADAIRNETQKHFQRYRLGKRGDPGADG